MKHVVIIGGGISGLSCAFYALRQWKSSIKVTIVEKSSLFGGWIKSSIYHENIILESGPRTIRTNGIIANNTLRLVQDIGAENYITGVQSNDPRISNRYIYYNQKLHQLPKSMYSLLKKNSITSKPLAYYIVKEPFVSIKQYKKWKQDDQTIYNFISQRFGYEIADFLIDPLCKGIFAGDSKTLSVRSCFPSLFTSINNHGSIVIGSIFSSLDNDHFQVEKNINNRLIEKANKEKWSLWYIKNGLEHFPNYIYSYLCENYNDQITFLKNETAVKLDLTENNYFKVQTDKQYLNCDHLFAAIPSHSLIPLLSTSKFGQKDMTPDNVDKNEPLHLISNELSKISFADVAVVNLVYRIESREEMEKLPQGFGYLVPSKEETPLLGTIFDWSIYTSPTHQSHFPKLINLTCMIGGAWMDKYFGEFGRDDNLFLNCAMGSVRKHLKIHSDPVFSKVTVNRKCIPQYSVGHYKIVQNLEKLIAKYNIPLSLIGSSYEGVSINDCIYNSKKSCESLINKF